MAPFLCISRCFMVALLLPYLGPSEEIMPLKGKLCTAFYQKVRARNDEEAYPKNEWAPTSVGRKEQKLTPEWSPFCMSCPYTARCLYQSCTKWLLNDWVVGLWSLQAGAALQIPSVDNAKAGGCGNRAQLTILWTYAYLVMFLCK